MDDRCGLVQALMKTDGSSLDDRCIWDYRIGHKSRKYSIETVTFAEKPRAIELKLLRVLCQELSGYRVL